MKYDQMHHNQTNEYDKYLSVGVPQFLEQLLFIFVQFALEIGLTKNTLIVKIGMTKRA